MNYIFLKKCSFIISLFLYLISPLIFSRTWKNGKYNLIQYRIQIVHKHFPRKLEGDDKVYIPKEIALSPMLQVREG